MAGRRGYSNKPGRGKARSGLRSQVAEVAITEETEDGALGGATAMAFREVATMAEREDVEWNTEASDEDSKGYEDIQGARPKIRKGHERVRASEEPPRPGEPSLVSMFKDFLVSQRQREDILVRELQQLKTAITVPRTSPAPLQQAQVGDASQNANPSIDFTPERPRRQSPMPAPRTQPPRSLSTLSPQSSSSMGPSQPVAHSDPPMRQGPKMLPFQQGEDIENFLVRFERIARTWGWPQSEWACRLVPLLTGKALDAYSSMEEDASNVYANLKEALLAKFDISPETYRFQFRSTHIPIGESPRETYDRLKGLYRRWIKPEQRSKEDIAEIIVLEQLLRMLPNDMKTWVKEHEPEDGLTAAKLAGQYLNARKGLRAPRQQNRVASQDAAEPPRRGGDHKTSGPVGGQGTSGETKGVSKPGPVKDLICYYCQQPGHRASVCPLKGPKLSSFCHVPHPSVPAPVMAPTLAPDPELELDAEPIMTPACVNGQQVQALLDTGSSMTLLHKSFVSLGSLDYRHATAIQCVHGDQRPYPVTDVTIVIEDQAFLLRVGVLDNMPHDMILGRDLPILNDLIRQAHQQRGKSGSATAKQDAFAVLTRSQKAKPGLEPLPDLDPSLCQGGQKGPQKSRRQRRLEKMQGTPLLGDLSDLKPDEEWQVPEDIRELQKADASLAPLLLKVKDDIIQQNQREKYLLEDGVLYVADQPENRLVVPTTCRPLVLHLGHSIPWAGHLGQDKTLDRVKARFFWPLMVKDVIEYCQTCPQCQKTSPRRPAKVPLLPLPLIDVPFRRIAMDIVGPLEKSSTGQEYILVLCDYATRFPEAFPLRSIKTPKIISSLVQFFSRVGIPDEIITDQGTNFTSKLMKQLHQQLGITGIRTTPYHPQTDGLVERFNSTLKSMLRKFVDDTGRDWDKWLPFVLFAYREVPQASTGFSPFELLYGFPVQGPLDLLKKSWEAKQPAPQGVLSYVLQMRDRLEQYRAEAKHNLRKAQLNQKTWYDQKARHRVLQPGQKVMLLLPTSSNKLLAQWQGPFPVLRQVGPVTYEVSHPGKGKASQVYHINLLKEWKDRKHHMDGMDVQASKAPTLKESHVEKVMLAREVEKEDSVEETDLSMLTTAQPPDVSHLSAQSALEFRQMCEEFPTLFSGKPGKTPLIEHVIRLKNSTPIRQRPYRVPERMVEPLNNEIQTMLDLGVIEPSNSEWCNPIVLVPKKDNTIRLCNDLRKVNAVSKFDAYPMPRIDELLEKLGKAVFITTLDLCKGYWQVPLEKESREYTAFRGPKGLYHYTVMPFGLHGAPATFQRLMDRALQGCAQFCAAYLDDVVVFSTSWEDHLSHLRQVLHRIHSAGLTLNTQKCEWAKREVCYLGYHLGNGQIRPQVDKVKAIRDSPRPRTKKQVRSFLGLSGWYRRFVPHFSTITAPLVNLTTKNSPNPVKWTEECETAFTNLKALLCSSPVLQSPDFNQRFLVQVDASGVGLGAVLAQGTEGEEQPLLYLSRKLQPRETRYSAIEKECLAIKWALDSLRYYLLGRTFDLETDHRALSWINSMKDKNSRVTRWYLALQPYNFNITHRAGKSNLLADYLSRLPELTVAGEEGGNVTV